jgi:two-component system, OmpR family, sensor kinase
VVDPSAWQEVERESERMQRVVDDLVTLVRLDPVSNVGRGLVDVARVASDAVSGATVADRQRTYQFVPPSEPALIIADEDHIRRLFDNLLSNIALHTPWQTTGTVSVSVVGPTVTCTVSDDGGGMTPDQIARSTDRHWSGDTARRSAGSGLGLAIVKGVTQAHGGILTVQQSQKGGLLVRAQFPAAVGVEGEPQSNATRR